jgi:DNA helicase TIP49 (TBP-interacting protein)
MKNQPLRLALIVAAGVVVFLAGKPVMSWIMLLEENQKAKIVEPLKGDVVGFDSAGGLVQMPGTGSSGKSEAAEVDDTTKGEVPSGGEAPVDGETTKD